MTSIQQMYSLHAAMHSCRSRQNRTGYFEVSNNDKGNATILSRSEREPRGARGLFFFSWLRRKCGLHRHHIQLRRRRCRGWRSIPARNPSHDIEPSTSRWSGRVLSHCKLVVILGWNRRGHHPCEHYSHTFDEREENTSNSRSTGHSTRPCASCEDAASRRSTDNRIPGILLRII